jgi:hypothetical protein
VTVGRRRRQKPTLKLKTLVVMEKGKSSWKAVLLGITMMPVKKTRRYSSLTIVKQLSHEIEALISAL